VDLILDAGPLKGGIGSTVVDVTADPPKILREGAISAKDIFIALEDSPDFARLG
jgi:L-threonylcarbamoyladenylate synthase